MASRAAKNRVKEWKIKTLDNGNWSETRNTRRHNNPADEQKFTVQTERKTGFTDFVRLRPGKISHDGNMRDMIFCEELIYSSGVMGSSKALTIATAASLPIRPNSLDLISHVYAFPPCISETCWVVCVYAPSVSAWAKIHTKVMGLRVCRTGSCPTDCQSTEGNEKVHASA